MFEPLKKAAYLSIGMAFMAKDKVEEAARRIAEEAKLGEGEGRKFVSELVSKAGDARDTLENTVSSMVQGTLNRLSIPRKEDIDRLEQRLTALEARMGGQTPAAE